MPIVISGEGLTIASIAAVGRGEGVALTTDARILERFHRSRDVIRRGVEAGEEIYGVTTLYGGMANARVAPERLIELQKVSLWHHKSTTGPRLREADVRAAMLLRANSLIKGASGVRLELVERLIAFLNAKAHPHVYERGSIGASGDLVPLSYVAGAILGLDRGYLVDMDGETLDSHAALAKLGLAPLTLEPKEGLALNNGTGASTGVAANACARAFDVMSLTLGVHALLAQALLATDQSFQPFIHAVKPHPGQVWTAARMAELLAGSRIVRNERRGDRSSRAGGLIQDRYSLRCLPQFLGPVIDTLGQAARWVEVEANSANDNPLIDPESGEIYHTGNFLAQYTGVAMDQMRYALGLMAKHLDAQIALVMSPEFSNGLSPSLVGDMTRGTNVGLKSLQIGGNSLAPLIAFYGQSIVDRFPTHAEQFNQNINSQAMNAANLARDLIDVLEHYLSLALVTAVQAVELRAKLAADTFDARAVLSPATAPLYAAARAAALGAPEASRPLHWEDLEAFIQPKIEGVLANLAERGSILESIAPLREQLAAFARV